MTCKGAQACFHQAAACSGDHAERLGEAGDAVGLLSLVIDQDAVALEVLDVDSLAPVQPPQALNHLRVCLKAALVQMGHSLIQELRRVLQLLPSLRQQDRRVWWLWVAVQRREGNRHPLVGVDESLAVKAVQHSHGMVFTVGSLVQVCRWAPARD